MLDSDLYPSLPPGNYIVYSGVYDSTARRPTPALPQLGDDFPDASVIHVSTDGREQHPQAGDTTSPDLGGVNGEVTISPTPRWYPARTPVE